MFLRPFHSDMELHLQIDSSQYGALPSNTLLDMVETEALRGKGLFQVIHELIIT